LGQVRVTASLTEVLGATICKTDWRVETMSAATGRITDKGSETIAKGIDRTIRATARRIEVTDRTTDRTTRGIGKTTERIAARIGRIGPTITIGLTTTGIMGIGTATPTAGGITCGTNTPSPERWV
jgi:hypothetical protein